MRYDEIGYWSEVKLDIVREYAAAYSKIMSAQKRPALYHLYIDAFAGAGLHKSKATGDWIPGSPLNALRVEPPLREYHLIDLSSEKVHSLRELTEGRPEVRLYQGDCNKALLDEVFPQTRYGDYRRALCLLDPYGLHLEWPVIECAGKMRSVELFLNFPVADINRNVLWRNPEQVDSQQAVRITAFWGDELWKKAGYDTMSNLFGFKEKQGNETVVEAFRQRLKKVAGYAYVPEPMPMRNSKKAVVYYLFFASHKPAAASIVKQIFDKHRDRIT